MKQSFLQKEFEIFDSYGFAPRITIEMANRIVGTKTPKEEKPVAPEDTTNS